MLCDVDVATELHQVYLGTREFEWICRGTGAAGKESLERSMVDIAASTAAHVQSASCEQIKVASLCATCAVECGLRSRALRPGPGQVIDRGQRGGAETGARAFWRAGQPGRTRAHGKSSFARLSLSWFFSRKNETWEIRHPEKRQK